MAFQEDPLPTSVPTVADLATPLATTADGVIVSTTGYDSPGDNGAGQYIYHRSGRSLVTISDVYIAGSDVDDYFELVTLNECLINQFGVKGDGIIDDREALLAADSAATAAGGIAVALTPGVYKISSNLTFANHVRRLDGASLRPDNGVVVTLENGFTGNLNSLIFDISNGGSFVIQKASQISAENFGADPTGVVDSTDELQAFLTATSDNDCGVGVCNGTYLISNTLNIGSDSPLAIDGQCRTKRYQGSMIINCVGSFDIALDFRVCYHVRWSGQIRVNGTGGTYYNTRTITHGVRMRGVNHCVSDGFYVQNMLGDPVAIDSSVGGPQFRNFTYDNTITDIFAIDCGSTGVDGLDIASVTGSWSGRVDTGSSGSFDQISTITIDNLPPASTDNIVKTMLINGKFYNVKTLNRGASTVSLYPWVTPVAAMTGTYKFVYGGIRTIGAEVAGNTIHHISCIRTGYGLSIESLYGPTLGIVQTQFCGAGISVGSTNDATVIGMNVNRFYGEDTNQSQFLLKTLAAKAINISVMSPAMLSKIETCAAPTVGVWNIPNPNFHSLYGCSFGTTQGIIEPNKPLNNYEVYTGTVEINAALRGPVSYYSNNLAVTVLLSEPAIIEKLGVDSFSFVVFGSGPNGSPTGTVTIIPPAGWKINGGTVGASAAFTTFTNAPTFHGYMQLAEQNIIVSRSPA